jgi:hypothetical protein
VSGIPRCSERCDTLEAKALTTYEQALALTDKSYESVRKASEVAKRFEIGRRRPLPFAHHQEVAWLDPSQQDAILDQAEREGSSDGVDAGSEHDLWRISPKVAGSMVPYPLIPFYPY